LPLSQLEILADHMIRSITRRGVRRIVFAGVSAVVCSLSLHASAICGADVDPRFETARVHFQRGRIAEALEVYDQLAEQKVDPTRVAIGKSRCLEFQGDWQAATEAVEDAVKLNDADPLLATRLAEICLAQGRFDDATQHLARALELNAQLPQAKLVEADLFAAQGKLKQADDGYHWFVKYYNMHQPEEAETLLLVARGASQYARWHGVPQIFDFVVNTLCTDALAKDKECWQAHLIAGLLLLEKYNRAQAIPELKHALAINPHVAEVHAGLALAALQDRGLADAAAHAKRALDANPRSPFALRVQADILLEDGLTAEAIKSLELALAVNPRDEAALGRLAACRAMEDGLPPEAELDDLFGHLDAIDEAETKTPSRFGALVAAAAGWNPHPGVLLFAAGEQLESRKKYDIAERCYRQAVASMPQLAAPKSALGMLYMRTGRIPEAQKLLDQAFESDPYHVRVSNMRKVLKLLDGYQTITTDHFIIRVDSQADLVLGRYMAEYLEAEYPALVQQYGYEPATRTQFEVYNKGKGLSAHQWFSARMVGLPWVQTIGASTGMIVALASPTGLEKPFNWARVVKHEFVHILTLQQTNFNIPHWFTEALAVLSEDAPRPERWNQLLVERVPRGELLNLDTLNHGFTRPRSDNDWQMAYCQSRLYAEYMIEKFGPDKPQELLAAYRRNQTTDQAIPQVFGVEKAVFEQGYREYLDSLVTGLKAQKIEESITPGAAEREYKAHPDDTRIAARYAWELFKISKRRDARKIALEALDVNKTEPLAIIVMAYLELRAEDVPAAIGWLEPALDRDAPHPRVLDLLAELRFKQDEFDQAAELYELGLKHVPDHVPWMRGLAATYAKQKDIERLKPVLERLMAADGDNASVRKSLARFALEDEQFAEAIRYGRQALYIDVLDVETHRILARAYAGQKEFDKAMAEWSVALELKPGTTEIAIELARAEAAAGKKDAALKRLKKILDREADNAEAQKALDELE
jgi:tetratricopeptide (TPR) repeat protein